MSAPLPRMGHSAARIGHRCLAHGPLLVNLFGKAACKDTLAGRILGESEASQQSLAIWQQVL